MISLCLSAVDFFFGTGLAREVCQGLSRLAGMGLLCSYHFPLSSLIEALKCGTLSLRGCVHYRAHNLNRLAECIIINFNYNSLPDNPSRIQYSLLTPLYIVCTRAISLVQLSGTLSY